MTWYSSAYRRNITSQPQNPNSVLLRRDDSEYLGTLTWTYPEKTHW